LPIIDETVPNEIRLFLQKQGIDPDDLIVVAFSGGSDSLSLLAALSSLKTPSSLLAVYVNHRIRSDSELAVELALNDKNCKDLGIPLIVVDLGAGEVERVSMLRSSGTEEAARTLRYAALSRICQDKGAHYLATAHTCDDQMETVLMRVFQGSPVSALGGIEPFRENHFDGISLIRPVLELSHLQLQTYLQERGLVWTEDSTNLSDKYFRNALRHTVSPAILSLFPQAYRALGRLNQRTREVSDFLDKQADKAMMRIDVSSGISMELAFFLSLEPVVRDTVLYRMFDHLCGGNPIRISYAMVQRLRGALEASKPDSAWTISALGTTARFSQGIFTWNEENWAYQYCLELKNDGKGCIVELPNGLSLSVEQYTADSDPTLIRIEADSLKNPIVRSPLEGDVISLQGKTVLLSKLFSEWKIPSSVQPCIPVLEDNQGIVVVFGRIYGGRDRLCARCKSTLAHGSTNIYSIIKRNECREI
jgi:tRNA(Ile)-lysidine synthase